MRASLISFSLIPRAVCLRVARTGVAALLPFLADWRVGVAGFVVDAEDLSSTVAFSLSTSVLRRVKRRDGVLGLIGAVSDDTSLLVNSLGFPNAASAGCSCLLEDLVGVADPRLAGFADDVGSWLEALVDLLAGELAGDFFGD